MRRTRIFDAVKRSIQRSDLLNALANVIWYRKRLGYLEYVNGYFTNPEIVQIQPGTDGWDDEKGQRRPICLIETWNKTQGFAAGLREALDGIYFCRRYGFQPFIRFHEDSLYKDEIFPETMNPFEYFFETESIRNEVFAISPQVIYHPRNRVMAEQLTHSKRDYGTSEEYISAMAKIWGRDIRLKQDIQDLTDELISEKGIGSDCLGVHFRGTDFKVRYYNHPIYVSLEEYYPYIEEAMRTDHFSKIFIATDDIDALHELIRHLGEDRVIYDETLTRISGTNGVHTSVNSGFKNGLDVLKDMSALAACGGLISGASKVAQIARIIKKSKGQEYTYDKYLFKGIVEYGKVFDIKGDNPVTGRCKKCIQMEDNHIIGERRTGA